MGVDIIEETDLVRWDEDLGSLGGSVLLSSGWLESFADSHLRPLCFRFSVEGETIGLAGGLLVEPSRRFLRGLYRNIVMFSGPAMAEGREGEAGACLEALGDYAAAKGYSRLIVNSWDYPHEIEFSGEMFAKAVREEYIVDMRGDLTAVMGKMRESIAQQRRQAERKGARFHESDSAEIIDDLERLLEETKSVRLAKGYEEYSYYYMPYLSRGVLERLFRNGTARVFYAERDGVVACAMLFVVYGRRACALLVGTGAEGYPLRAPAFLWHNIIEKLKGEGYEYVNLGGIPKGVSTDKLIFAKTALGGERHVCMGGTTGYLNKSVLNVLGNAYRKMSDNAIKKVIRRLIKGGNG